MFSRDDGGQLGLVLRIASGLVAGVIALLVSVAIWHRYWPTHSMNVAPVILLPPAVSPVLPAATAVSASQSAQAASDAASVTVEHNVVKFYFASGSAELAAGAGNALGDMVRAAKSGRKLVVSGFHDTTGDARRNAGLAGQRALAVRDTLQSLGVAGQQIELRKPEQMDGDGSDAQARRVEIRLQ